MGKKLKMKIGHGYDVHKFGGDGPIILGGVAIDNPQGLLAHSDGDVLIHALCDALLGALGLGDIGHWFPDTDPKLKGVDSRYLLRKVAELIHENQYCLGNADITIIAQIPKMAPHLKLMKTYLAQDLKTCDDQINIKATTTEGLGFAGRKEGIAVHAVVLLMQQAQSQNDSKPS